MEWKVVGPNHYLSEILKENFLKVVTCLIFVVIIRNMATNVWKRLKSKFPSRYMAKIYIIVFINLVSETVA